ncbi:antibiotic biosynthesis monooxygenase [uncultured Veillonella sp.]|uniref:putative quinol monooxygenase n=1 Tax=uncultured Veillonella sp. TaxID=159268 RepID=UPI00320A7140
MNRTLLKRIIITSAIAVLGVSTSFAALVMERDQSVDTAPSVNMYRFEVPADLQGIYNNVGVANLTASMEKEPNTLSMNVAHVKGNPSESYVVEIYKDLAAIETHRKSEHYQAFVNEVGSKLTNRKMYDVQSVLLFEKKDALSIVNDGKAVVTLTEFTVNSNDIDTVQRQYQLDIERVVRDDAGYKAGYVLRERNVKNHWYVIQIYSNQDALTKHLNSPGYRFMMSQIQGSLQNVTTKVLDGDVLVNHGGQAFVRP